MADIEIRSDALTARIAPLGAELVSLTDAAGRELMSSGDPAFWRGRAPVLFPIVGRLNRDRYRHDRAEYAMPKHGFARRSSFALVERGESSALFRLTDSDATRAAYPFAFALDMAFALDGASLTMTAIVRNTGDMPLPASFGFHPAFAWPLPFGRARADHRIVFERAEPAPLRALTPEGLVKREHRESPVKGDTLMLRDDLFADDALIWDRLSSRRLRYGAGDGPALDIEFPDTDMLGIWTKPGAAFVCVEPWAGLADPEGYDGDFRAKPGVFEVAPGSERAFRMMVTLSE